MKQLIWSQAIHNAHEAYWKRHIVPSLVRSKTERVFAVPAMRKTHVELLTYCIDSYKQLATGKPDALCVLASKLRSQLDGLSQVLKEEEFAAYTHSLLPIFGYERFSDRFPKTEDLKEAHTSGLWEKLCTEASWSAYAFVMAGGLRVCPYCNRQYITPLIELKKDGSIAKVRGDLDHFYPKSIYPFLSMSLYNLIPCCKFCNSSFKGTDEFSPDTLHPSEGNIHEHFRFVSDFAQAPRMPSVQIEHLDHASGKKVNDYTEMFQLEAQYSFHGNQIKELMDKRQIYSDSYIMELFTQYPSLFPSIQSVVEAVIGYFPDASRLNDEVLAKFRRDIALQLGFHTFSLPREQLNEKKRRLLQEG